MMRMKVLVCLLLGVLSVQAGHRLILAEGGRQIGIVEEDGSVSWSYSLKGKPVHDVHLLDNGNVLCQLGWQRIVEISPAKEIVWEYDAGKQNGNAGKRVEVHAFQRLADGVTMIVESGPCRIIEVDRGGKILKQFPMKVKDKHPHKDTRLVRKLANGHYLAAHEGDGWVREYDATGKVVWEYDVPLFDKQPKGGHGPDSWGDKTFCALRLKNGNTLVATGNGHSVLEVTPEKEIVWSVTQNELDGVQLAWVTTLEELPKGNFLIGNCHAGPKNPQIIEVNREKKVVWKFHDFKNFGNNLANWQRIP